MIFDYWRNVCGEPFVHPDDQTVMRRYAHKFDVQIPAGHINGRLKTAPIVACFLNPRLTDEDRTYLTTNEGRKMLLDQAAGESDFPSFQPWRDWLRSKISRLGLSDDELRRDVAVFNVCAYASKDSSSLSPYLVNNLHSALIARRYLRDVLIPQAVRGERFVVICRGAWAWGVRPDEAGIKGCLNIRFASPRGGAFGPAISDQVSTWLRQRQA